MLDFATVLRAPTFKFLVGRDRDSFNVPTTLAKGISSPLYTLMSNSQMKEAKDGVAVLEEVESEIFTAFCEYAYTGAYQVPRVAVDLNQSQESFPGYSPPLAPPPPPAEPTAAEEPAATEEPAAAEEPAAIEEPAATLLEPEGDSWAFGFKKIKKKGGRPGSSVAGGWENFCDLKYDVIPEESEERPRHPKGITEIEFKPLLFHCKLYVFAHMYLVISLSQLTLRKLHASLKSFDLSPKSSDEVLEAIEFAFENTERAADHDDELRKLLVAYAASKTRTLKQNESFRTLLDAHGELGSDMVQLLG